MSKTTENWVKAILIAMFFFLLSAGALTYNIFFPGTFNYVATGNLLWVHAIAGACIFLATTLSWAGKIPFEATKKWDLVGFTSLGVTLFAVWQLSIRHDIVNHPNLSGLVALMAIAAITSAISHWNDIVRQKRQRIGK